MKWFKWYPPKPPCEKHCWHFTLPEGAWDPNPDKCCKCGRSREYIARPTPEGHGKHMPPNYDLEP